MTSKSATPTDAPSGLYLKLLVAQTTAQAVEKAGRNDAQSYNYAKAEDVIAEAQRALHEAKLVGFMRPVEIDEREITAQSGSGGLFVSLKAELVIVDPDHDGDFARNTHLDGTLVIPAQGTGVDGTLVIPAQGTGVDYPGDKAVYKAMTGAAKYAYSSALGIPFTDDPERDVAGAGQARKASGAEASPAQKRLVTTIFNRAGISREWQVKLIEALDGVPLSKSGASAILDRIADKQDDPEGLKAEIDKLFDEAKVDRRAPLPGDEHAEADAEKAHAAAEQGDAELFPTDEERGQS